MSEVLGLAGLVWHSLSPLGLGLGLGGLGLIVIAGFGLIALPGWLTRPAIVAGAALLILGAVDQDAFARATVGAEKRKALEIALANQKRAEAAETAVTADLTRAAADAATIQAMRREIDATPRNPGACLPADAAGRLRRIR